MSNGARVLAIMVAAAVLALIGGVIYALWLIGAETARALACICQTKREPFDSRKGNHF